MVRTASSRAYSGVSHRAGLMLTTAGFEPCAVIQATARTVASRSVMPVPVHGRIRSAWTRTFRATPNVRPASRLATCVRVHFCDPGGSQSSADGPGRSGAPLTKSPIQSTRPSNSWCVRRMPVSMKRARVDTGPVTGPDRTGRRAEARADRAGRGATARRRPPMPMRPRRRRRQ